MVINIYVWDCNTTGYQQRSSNHQDENKSVKILSQPDHGSPNHEGNRTSSSTWSPVAFYQDQNETWGTFLVCM